jgi:2-aminomuconate deaminase
VSGRGKDIVSSRAPEPVGAFPHAKRVGDFLFLSGIGPRKRGTKEIPADFESQVLAVFENVRLVLEDAGARWEDIVDVTVFLTDMKADFPAFNRLYAEHFATNRPTRTTVEVGALPTPIDVELKVIAYVNR